MPIREALAEARVIGPPSETATLPVMPGSTLLCLTVHVSGPILGAAIGLAGVLAGLWVNGDRAERDRRRRLHARALKAIIDYGEMPFMIRRRRHEESNRSAERVRLSDHFSAVKAEITTSQVLLAADGHEAISVAYNELVEEARRTAGADAHKAWTEEPVFKDEEMNMGDVFERLAPFRARLDRFERDLARATLPRRTRLWRWLRRR